MDGVIIVILEPFKQQPIQIKWQHLQQQSMAIMSGLLGHNLIITEMLLLHIQ